MEIKRVGSQPSAVPPTDYLTGRFELTRFSTQPNPHVFTASK
jgi:hypothetical protein